MKVDEFLVEKFLNAYEHNVEVNLGETCVEPFTLGEFLKLIECERFFNNFKKAQLTYGFVEGDPELRKGLASLYKNMRAENIITTLGAIGANFLVFYSLVDPGDTVISIFPTYQQLYSVPKSFGANVKLLRLRPENGWIPETNELSKLIDEKTKLIVINNPHNPSGSLINAELLKEICSLAEDADAYVLCDESYRGLYIKPRDYVPSAVDLSDRAIATGSFSKAFSLSGLRLGWIAADENIIKECMLHRDYTTISTGIIDNALAALAIKHKDRIYERNLKILRTNHEILTKWIENENLIDWVPPKAGSVAFLKYKMNVSSKELCLRLIREKKTLLVPGSCFEMEGYLRIGYGCKTQTLTEGLLRFKQILNSYHQG
ncbi:MAG: aminotransferase class I/II-fold pyridoxal phosphate-dependent enzyme [Candidatus Bathyarchaeia archaeon]